MKERYIDSVFSKAGADPDPRPHLTTGVQVLAEHAGTTLQEAPGRMRQEDHVPGQPRLHGKTLRPQTR